MMCHPGSTFWLYIERVALHGAINGYPCGGQGEPCPGRYFRPQGTLTRGQAAKIVSITAGYLDVIPPNQQTFTDVSPDSTFWVYVERVALHGVVSGYSDGTFRPANPATRGRLPRSRLSPSCRGADLRESQSRQSTDPWRSTLCCIWGSLDVALGSTA